MEFLIQTIKGEVKHDFSFTLIESCNYHNWLNKDSFKYFLSYNADRPGYIPIGSVEFVMEYLMKYYKLIPKPINVPEELFKYAGRELINGTEKDICGEKFVKSNDIIKSFTEVCTEAPPGNYQISSLIDIISEWRAFIFKGELVGLQNYSGDFTIFPDVYRIKEMIRDYKDQPISYTLDVAISGTDTLIMEVHDFFSCGLYGFSDHKILPYMFSRWFYSFIRG